MNGPELLAGRNVVQQIRQAFENDDVNLSGKTQVDIVEWGIPRCTIIQAIIRHIDEGRKIHIKVYSKGGQGYDGSLLIGPEFDEIYFEIKLPRSTFQPNFGSAWLQVHEHEPGIPKRTR